METAQMQQTEHLIIEMLGFLESNSEDEEDNELQQQQQPPVINSDSQCELETNLTSAKKNFQKAGIAKQLKKIKLEYPISNTSDISCSNMKLNDSIWHQKHLGGNNDVKSTAAAANDEWHVHIENDCRRSRSNAYVQEVNRAIYGDTSGYPANGSAEYFQAAQNYALYGKDFLDFPENLTPLLGEKVTSTKAESAAAAYGNGIFPTPSSTPEPFALAGISFNNFGKHSSAAAAAAYYQIYNGMQNTLRPAVSTATAYGMILGNKVTYVAAAPVAPQPLVYNQHTSTTTNFISNSIANAALTSTPTILYSNPMLATTTQQYLNTFFKETQYLSSVASTAPTAAPVQGTTATIATTTGLFYAQMLQQQIYHQTQAAAVAAAMFQHKQRTTRSNGSNAINAQQLCGRQAAAAAVSNAADLLAKPVANGAAALTAALAIPANAAADDSNMSLCD